MSLESTGPRAHAGERRRGVDGRALHRLSDPQPISPS